MNRFFLVVLACVLLCACEGGENYAPVTELSTIEPIPRSGVHNVTSGETLYEVAWRYGLDYRDVVAQNKMQAPYAIHSGQSINLRGNEYVKPVKRTMEVEPKFSTAKWIWPANGKVINYYSNRNKGLNISGRKGEPIYAAAAGKVVYAGNGLRGYGNLIILKHNSTYLSAYAHTKVVFVKEGAVVKQGQKIAEMGNSGTDVIMLHFEIRRAGRPVDPINLLKGRI